MPRAMGLEVIQIITGSFQVFTYIISSNGKCAVIDPAGDEQELIKIIEDKNFSLEYILNTHAHADHILGNRKLKEYFNAPVCMHKVEVEFFLDKSISKQIAKDLGIETELVVDRKLNDGDMLSLGHEYVKVIHTPGHTPGSVCFLIDNNLFTGDTLFVGAAGRTDLVGGSLNELLSSLKRLIELPPQTVIWPGHDYGERPVSTIADEIRENPYITDFIL